MRRQLENFANALSDYSGEDVDTPKDWHAAFRMLKNYLLGVCRPGKLVVFLDEVPWMETRKSDFVQDNYGDDENFWTNRIDSSMHRAWTGFAFELYHISKLLWAYQVWLPVSVHGEAK